MLGLPESLTKISDKTSEPLTSKNFLDKLKDIKFDPETAIKESVDVLNSTRGFKLVKAEALAENGKIMTVDEMEEVSARGELDRADIEAFLKLNGGDKFLEKLFVYGVSRMKQDFYRKEKDFKDPSTDKPSGYKTFEQAFDAGAYDIKPDFSHIMMYGLSVTEYQNREERFDILRKKLKKIEAANAKAGLIEKIKDGMMVRPLGKDEEGRKPAERKEAKRVLTKLGRSTKAYERLISLGHAFKAADDTMVELKAKYPDSFRGIELHPFHNLDDEKDYQLQFLSAVKFAAAGADLTLEDALANVDVLTDENIEKLTDGYAVKLNERMEMMNSLLRGLYTTGGGGTDPRGIAADTEDQRITRMHALDAAEEKCPDIKRVKREMDALKNAYRSFNVMADGIN